MILKYIESATHMSRICLQLLTAGKEEQEKVPCDKFTFVSDQTADQAWQTGIDKVGKVDSSRVSSRIH